MDAVRFGPYFGTVYRYETPAAFEKLRESRSKQAIPFAHVSQAMLDDPMGETRKIGNYVINDDCGYPPPDGAPGYAFTATDALWAMPLIGKLKHQIDLHEAYSQPAAYTARQQLLVRALDLKSYAGYGGEPALSPANLWKLSQTIADIACEEAAKTAEAFKTRIASVRVRPYKNHENGDGE